MAVRKVGHQFLVELGDNGRCLDVLVDGPRAQILVAVLEKVLLDGFIEWAAGRKGRDRLRSGHAVEKYDQQTPNHTALEHRPHL